jgi:hypothetical protein
MLENYVFEKYPFAIDAVSGASAGAVSGALVAPAEALKIRFQRTPGLSYKMVLQDPHMYKHMFGSIPSFSTIFSVVCGLEFSVNDRIKHQYGNFAGITASAVTGSVFLTAADHLMLRRQHNENTKTALQKLCQIKPTALFTGCGPMVGREALFITSVMYLGPYIGSKLKGDSKETQYYNGIGRTVAGIPMTLLSQPFDSLTRKMQMTLINDPGIKPTLSDSLKKIQKELSNGSHLDSIKNLKHPLFQGAGPRMGLATFGGVLAGGFYDYFKSKLAPGKIEDTLKQPKPSGDKYRPSASPYDLPLNRY